MASRPRLFFYLPFAYFISTRLKDKYAFISWVMIYPLPIFLAVVTFTGALCLVELAAVLVAMLAVYCLYELGYIENDTLTIKQEAQPTLRLDQAELNYCAEHWRWIVLVRLFIVIVSMVVIVGMTSPSAPDIVVGTAGLVLLGVTFVAYNRFRGRINLPFHLVLVSCRFCLPGLVVVDEAPGLFFGLMFCIFPLANSIERMGEQRFRLGWVEWLMTSHLDFYRIGYYLICAAATGSLVLLDLLPAYVMVLPLYFLVYRLVSPIVFWLIGRVR